MRLVRAHAAEHPSLAAAIRAAARSGGSAPTLRLWVRQAARDAGRRDGHSDVRARLGAVERAGRERRQANAMRPNALWGADFTYVASWAGLVHVAFVVDAFARWIVGWRVSRSTQTGFVLDALAQALHTRRPVEGSGFVHRSDRGGQDVSIRYTERLAQAGIAPSVGSVGDSDYNALAETVIGLFNSAVIRRLGPWRSRAALAWATLAWGDWFNHRRRLEPRGTIPLAAAEARYDATPEERALAAYAAKPIRLRKTRCGSMVWAGRWRFGSRRAKPTSCPRPCRCRTACRACRSG